VFESEGWGGTRKPVLSEAFHERRTRVWLGVRGPPYPEKLNLRLADMQFLYPIMSADYRFTILTVLFELQSYQKNITYVVVRP